MEATLAKFAQTGQIQPVLALIQGLYNDKSYHLCINLCRFMLQTFRRNVDILSLMAHSHLALGEHAEAFDIYDLLLNQLMISGNLTAVITNRNGCIKHVLDRYAFYSEEKVAQIMNRPPKTVPILTVTITSCKRLELFQKTVNSFINCCADLHLIDKWLCVDDNSFPEDREKMKQLYPFFEFHFKSLPEKGHARSMNIIRDKVNTPFVLHLEDDWQFFSRRNYITDCLEVLAQDEKIGQCLFNRNYAETDRDIQVVGGLSLSTSSGLRYALHQWCRNEQEQQQFNQMYGFQPNCAYWPHYSLRPSILRKQILTELGPFDETVSHFEQHFSYKYAQTGYVSAFLETLYCWHIGRLTSERDDKTKLNAYDLNNEAQFANRETVLAQRNNIGLNISTVVINLDRRPDRWDHFTRLAEPKFLNYSRFAAIDGDKIIPTEQLQLLFAGNDYNMRAGMVGCALSHLQICINLLASSYDATCVLEDDITFTDNFAPKFLSVYRNLPADWDLCYLGHHVWPHLITADLTDRTANPIVEKWSTEKSLRISMGGTIGYLISRKGAKEFLDFVERNGLTKGIDTVQQLAADQLNVYYTTPMLVFSSCWQPNESNERVDTDIATNFKSLTIPIDRREKIYRQINTSVELVQYLQSEDERPVLYAGSDAAKLLQLAPRRMFYFDEQRVLIGKNLYRINRQGQFELPLSVQPLLISISSMTHVSEAIKTIQPRKEIYPFDLIDQGSIENIALLIELIINMTDEQVTKFSAEFFALHGNEIYIQGYNQKQVFRNSRYKIAFPHDQTATLAETYTQRFKAFRDAIISGQPIGLVYCSRWEQAANETFTHLMAVLTKINPNIKLLIINANLTVAGTNIFLARVPFPSQFHTSGWEPNKIRYDQDVFRLAIHDPIKQFSRC